MIDAAIYRKVLGNYPTGVCAVTALDDDDKPIALIVGSFSSVSLDPPLVGFFPGKESSTWPMLERAGRFCINVLASDQTDLCRQLATPGPDKFAGVGYALSTHGAPLLDGALAWIDCTLHDVLDAGDHYVVLGKVEHLDVSREGDPMLFFRGRYGGFRELM
jgi:3-hydroxy-9,10-secoandrosta-1,3,5(10)-triene-9,17-dione monooxygenase reductase component